MNNTLYRVDGTGIGGIGGWIVVPLAYATMKIGIYELNLDSYTLGIQYSQGRDRPCMPGCSSI